MSSILVLLLYQKVPKRLTYPQRIHLTHQYLNNENFYIFNNILFIVFTLVGIFGTMAYSNEIFKQYNDNLFTILNESKSSRIICKISVYAFPIAQNITTIPVLCVTIAFNIKNFGIDHRNALIISIVISILGSLLFYNGNGFNQICDWSSIFITIINYMLPPIMFIKMRKITNLNTQKIVDSSQVTESTNFLMNSHDIEMMELNKTATDDKLNVLDVVERKPFKISYAMMTMTSLLCGVIIYDKLFV